MDQFEKLYNFSLRFLSYRPRSEKEIKTFLSEKHAPQAIIDQILQKLKEQNFVNDNEFVKWWIEQRLTFKPKSLRIIKMELKQKGVSQETINNSQLTTKNDEENAKKLVQKSINKYKDLPKRELYQKLGAFLARKGFDWDTIKKAIDEQHNQSYNQNEEEDNRS